MSTKRLSRTVLEGGRYTRNKYDRYLSTKEERAAARDYITECIKDNELIEEEPLPVRRRVGKGFTDKLGPVFRWLDKRIGKSWANTFKLMKEKFDDRTLAGFHIVHQHMLAAIGTESQEKEVDYSYHEYYVDNNGILKKSAYKRYYYQPKEPFSDQLKNKMMVWMEGRNIGFIDGVLHWFHAADDCSASWDSHYGLKFRKWNAMYWADYYNVEFVIGPRCSAGDVNFFRSLPEWVRNKILEQSPARKKKDAA